MFLEEMGQRWDVTAAIALFFFISSNFLKIKLLKTTKCNKSYTLIYINIYILTHLTESILPLLFQAVTSHFEEYINTEVQEKCLLSDMVYLNYSSPHHLMVNSDFYNLLPYKVYKCKPEHGKSPTLSGFSF